jgi:peptidoglycan/xylan/chitin deacetylase (PgdA/CDA1 family)
MKLLKNASKLLTYFGIPRGIFNIIPKGAITVFNYHEISENPSDFSRQFNLAVHPEIFRKHLLWIKSNYTIVSPSQIMDKNNKLPKALITFDDGFASTFREGGKILQELNIPGVIFVNMGPIRGELFWSGLVNYLCRYNEDFQALMLKLYNVNIDNLHLYVTESNVYSFLKCTNSDQVLKKIKKYYGEFATEEDLLKSYKYNIYLGNHLYNHFNAANISVEKLKRQYLKNHVLLKRYSNFVNLFSYPYGQPGTCFTMSTDKIILDLGAKIIFTAIPFFNKTPLQNRLNRLSMFNHIDNEASFRYHCILPFLNYIFKKKYLSMHK